MRARWYVDASVLQETGVDGPAIIDLLRAAELELEHKKEAEREQKRLAKVEERNREKEAKQKERDAAKEQKQKEKAAATAAKEAAKKAKENPQRGAMLSFVKAPKKITLPTAVVDGQAQKDFDEAVVDLVKD